MEKIKGFQMTWTEAEEALQTLLDDRFLTLRRCGDDLYVADSDTQSLDTAQIDERLAQQLGISKCIGWACEDGIIVIDKSSDTLQTG